LRRCFWLAGGIAISLALSYPAAGQNAGITNLFIAAGEEQVPACKTFTRRLEPAIIRVESPDSRIWNAEFEKLKKEAKARHNSFIWSARVRPNQCAAVARIYMEKKDYKCSYVSHAWEIRATPEEARAAIMQRKFEAGFQRAEIIRTECSYVPAIAPPKSRDSSFGARG
jgi:hypothetical protein